MNAQAGPSQKSCTQLCSSLRHSNLVMPSQAQDTASGDDILEPTPAQTAKPKVSPTQASVVTRALSSDPPTHRSSGGNFDHDTLLSSPPAEQKRHFAAVCGSLEDQLNGRLTFAKSTPPSCSGSIATVEPEKRSSTLVISDASSTGEVLEKKETYERAAVSAKDSRSAASTFAGSMETIKRLHSTGFTGW